MNLVVDLHVHSHFSRATSRDMNIESLYRWGKIKGINIIGTGDFTHPDYFLELNEKLEPAEGGLYKLKDKFAVEQDKSVPKSCRANLIRFIPTVEICNIYSKTGKVRKVHNLLIVPDFKTASELNTRIGKIGNLRADGRPILGLACRELLKIVLETNPAALFIPAHIWTPWFGIFGSKSGFDSLEETFGDLAIEVKAMETGMSSDPYMNWRLSQLDNVTMISNSDAHSAAKLGREANLINAELSYQDISGAIRSGDKRFLGTIEFFPDEGKYHHDGHRNCHMRFTPSETRKLKGICPNCGKAITVGVESRVEDLADRAEDYVPEKHKTVEYIIPLAEIIAELKNVRSTASKTVRNEYEKIIAALGSEFNILRKVPVTEIRNAGFGQLAIAIEKLRKSEVQIEPGYDGVYGVVSILGRTEPEKSQLQLL
jgi:uncharacterized protein (TIGR00375 family)